jgi:membrane-associated phospholipid phosphatase
MKNDLRSWLLALVLCIVLAVFSLMYLDQPIANWVESNVRHTEVFSWITGALRPLVLVAVLAPFFLVACGCYLISGRRLPAWTDTPLLCAWSVVWALTATIVLKEISGRSWPDPSYVRNGIYEFRLLHGGPGHESFPSGTAAISAALAAVVWTRVRRLRIAWVLLFALPSTAVVLVNFHFLADAIAGAFLGISIGWMSTRLLPQNDNQSAC